MLKASWKKHLKLGFEGAGVVVSHIGGGGVDNPRHREQPVRENVAF